MLLCGLDLETTGIDVDSVYMTEVAMVLLDWDKHVPLKIISDFIYNVGVEIPEEVVLLNGITKQMTADYGELPEHVLKKIFEYMADADYLVGHNIRKFDLPILKRHALKYGLTMPELPVLDSRLDVPYPSKITSHKLTHLAAEHYFVNPFAHRALFDVMTMFQVMKSYDIEEVIKYAAAPEVTVRAMVTFDTNKLAKERGFHWDAEKKIWYRTLKQFQLEDLKKSAPFQIQVL